MNTYDRIYTLLIERRGPRSKRRNLENPGITRMRGLPIKLVTKERGGAGTGRKETIGNPGYLKHRFNKNRKRSIDPEGVSTEIQANINSTNAPGHRTGR